MDHSHQSQRQIANDVEVDCSSPRWLGQAYVIHWRKLMGAFPREFAELHQCMSGKQEDFLFSVGFCRLAFQLGLAKSEDFARFGNFDRNEDAFKVYSQCVSGSGNDLQIQDYPFPHSDE